TGGFQPVQAAHIRDSALCGTCHQLYTTAHGKQGKPNGSLPEQMPYLEWLHSDYPSKYSCQGCHMPEVAEQVQVSSVLGLPPTAYPSRRAWLHFSIQDRNGHTVFESGALKPDGSIVGNDNDADPSLFEPHYRQITEPGQVQIYESILKDEEGHVTTGLLAATGYLKDNRLIPTGFDKSSAEKDIAVVGDAADDPKFSAGEDAVSYSVPVSETEGPFHIYVELLYQPIGFRWAHNLEPYSAMEPQRFVRYYDS